METIADKMVLVKWVDAKIYPGMHKANEALDRKMDTFESLGFLLSKDDRVTRIAHEVADTGEYRDVLLIPSGSVVSIHQLASTV